MIVGRCCTDSERHQNWNKNRLEHLVILLIAAEARVSMEVCCDDDVRRIWKQAVHMFAMTNGIATVLDCCLGDIVIACQGKGLHPT